MANLGAFGGKKDIWGWSKLALGLYPGAGGDLRAKRARAGLQSNVNLELATA